MWNCKAKQFWVRLYVVSVAQNAGIRGEEHCDPLSADTAVVVGSSDTCCSVFIFLFIRSQRLNSFVLLVVMSDN